MNGVKMKRNFFILFTLFFLIFSTFALSTNSKELHIFFDHPELKFLKNGYTEIHLKNSLPAGNPGNPALPVYPVKVLVPYGFTLSNYTISFGHKKLLGSNLKINYIPYPALIGNNFSTMDKGPDEKIYSSNLPYPAQKNYYSGGGFYRGYRIEMINICPFEYIPSEGKLYFYKDAVIKLKFCMTKSNQKGYKFLRASKSDEDEISSIVENPEEILSYRGHGKKSSNDWEYLIITNNNMQATFQTLADYKSSKYGLNTHIELISNILNLYQGGDDAEKLRNFIIDAYQNHGTRWVVLGGDAEVIPFRECYGQLPGSLGLTIYDLPTDFYFAALDGNWDSNGNGMFGEPDDNVDLFAEVNVGRISASYTDEAENQINKIINYENWEDAPFRALLLGEKLWDYTWGGDSKDYVYEVMGGIPCDRLYDKNGEWDKYTLINNYLNSNNLNIINHLGHSNDLYAMRLSVTDVPLITNRNPFFVYSQGCYPGDFPERNLCFAEKITVGTPNGAFAVIMNSRYGLGAFNSVYGVSNIFDREFMKAIFEKFHRNIGYALNESRAILSNFINSDTTYRWVAYELTLFGCPHTPLHWKCNGDENLVIEEEKPKNNFIYMTDTDVPVEVMVHTNCLNGVENPEVFAEISVDTSKETITIELKDDGIYPDKMANDGIFTGMWHTSGYGKASIKIKGNGENVNPDEITINGEVVDKMEYTISNCSYNFIDISDGNEILINSDDWGEVVPIGFNFKFFGKEQNKILISSNGILRFDNSYTYDGLNFDIPTTFLPNGLIAVYWVDLSGNDSSHIYYKTVGDPPNRKFIVEYKNISLLENASLLKSSKSFPLSDSENSGTFEVILEESTNKIYFEYKDVYFGNQHLSNGLLTTIGIEDYTGENGIKYSYNSESIYDETAICFTPMENTPRIIVYGNPEIMGIDRDCLIPGETVNLKINLYNPSSLKAYGGSVKLIPIKNCKINTLTQNIGDMESGKTSSAYFSITVDSDANCGESVNFIIKTRCEDESGGEIVRHFPVSIKIGKVISIPLFQDDFEGEGSNWSTQLDNGNDTWHLTTENYHSLNHSYFSSDEDNLKDDFLISDYFPVENGAKLEFYHYFKLENDYDGGVLEIEEVGSSEWKNAEDIIISNGYTRLISDYSNSSIAGRYAWTGDSRGFIKTVVDLSSYGGKIIRIRFHLSCDEGVADTGWYIDDVKVYTDNFDCTPVLPGDVDGNGVVNIRDLMIMLYVVNGDISESSSPCVNPTYGDFDSNGEIDINDCIYLANILCERE